MTNFNISESGLFAFENLLKRAGAEREVKPSGTVDWALATKQDLTGSVESNAVGVDKEGNFHILRYTQTNNRTAYRVAPVEVQVRDGKVFIITKASNLSDFEVVTDPSDPALAPVHEIEVK